MANPYTHGQDLNPFAEDLKQPAARPAQAAPAAAAPAGRVSPSPQFYNPPTAQAAQGPAYAPPPANPQYVDPAHAHSVQSQPQPYHQQPPNQYGQPQPQGQPQPPPPDYGPPPAPARELQTQKFWTVEFYQQFFDVTTSIVLRRMGNVLLPFSPPDFLLNREWHSTLMGGAIIEKLNHWSASLSHTDGIEKFPDMYGPFWICTTLWIVIAMVGNAMSKIAHTKSKSTESWAYDFTIASVACITIYLYCVLMSLFVWGLMKWKNVPASLTDVLCLYGYSMFILLAAAILCACPNTAAQWIICVVSGLWSGTYLLMNFWQLWKKTMRGAWFTFVVCWVVIFQFALTASLKFYFFNYTI